MWTNNIYIHIHISSTHNRENYQTSFQGRVSANQTTLTYPRILSFEGRSIVLSKRDERNGGSILKNRDRSSPLCEGGGEKFEPKWSRKDRATWSVVDVILGSRESSVGIFKKAETWSVALTGWHARCHTHLAQVAWSTGGNARYVVFFL